MKTTRLKIAQATNAEQHQKIRMSENQNGGPSDRVERTEDEEAIVRAESEDGLVPCYDDEGLQNNINCLITVISFIHELKRRHVTIRVANADGNSDPTTVVA